MIEEIPAHPDHEYWPVARISSEKIAQCQHQPQSSSRRASSSVENKKAQGRCSKEEQKLLVQLWAEKHDQLESRESQGTNQHGVVLCSQIFLSVTVAFRTIFFLTGRFQVGFVQNKSEIAL